MVRAEAALLREFLEHGPESPDRDLAEGLRDAVRDARVIASHELELVIGPLEAPCTGRPAEALVNAAREALRNAQKHAAATSVVVYCEVTGGRALVTVKDDGVGADTSGMRTGIGIRDSIVARLEQNAGVARLESAPGAGMLVTLELPLQREAA